MPAMKRQTLRPSAPVCVAMAAEATAYHSSEMVKMVRRPNRSATKPNTIVPMNSPANSAATKLATPELPNRPGVVVVRMCSRTSAGAM